MISTPTPSAEGPGISAHHGVGEAILGADIMRDLFTGNTELLGVRSGAHEQETARARETAPADMKGHAPALGAAAVVGADPDREVINYMLMVSAPGTAATIKKG